MDEHVTTLREMVHIRERWAEFFHDLLNKKLLELHPHKSALYSLDDRSPYRLAMNQPWARDEGGEFGACRIGKRWD